MLDIESLVDHLVFNDATFDSLVEGAPITGTGYDGKTWELVHGKTGQPITPGKHKDFRGDTVHITSGEAPHKESSSGHVYTKDNRRFYAGVIDAKWQRKV